MPTVGAALVILAARPRKGHRLIDNPAMRLVGDRSYVIYLWHWPIIVAVRYRRDNKLGLVDMAGIVIDVLLLAELTMRLVENRSRLHGRRRVGRRSLVPVAS